MHTCPLALDPACPSQHDRPYLLAVEDPNDPDNDLGRNSYNISRVGLATGRACTRGGGVARLAARATQYPILMHPHPQPHSLHAPRVHAGAQRV